MSCDVIELEGGANKRDHTGNTASMQMRHPEKPTSVAVPHY
jgi:hypothetical protein